MLPQVMAALILVAASPVEIGERVRGWLEPGDETLDDGSYFDLFTLRGRAGDVVTIRLESDDFDPLLFLLGPDDYREMNDDADGTRNARITATLPATGEYTIGVNSYGGGAKPGAYVLIVEEGGAEAADQAGEDAAAPIRPGAPVEGSLGPGDPTLRSGEWYDLYVLDGRAGRSYALDLASSDFDPYLLVRGPGGFSEENDDYQGDRTRARIEFVAPADGAYRIAATTFQPGETGRYRLVVSDPEARGAAVGAAVGGAAVTLPRGRWVDGRLGAGSGTLPTGEYRDVYTFDGRRGEALSIEMASADVDAYLFLRGPGVQLDNDDRSDDVRDARIDATLPATGAYTVVATTYRAGEAGAYRIRLGGPDVAPPDAGAARPAPTYAPRVWGIFVGITDYRARGQPNLVRCADDATEMAAVLRRAGVSGPENQRVLTDGEATVANLRRAFDEIAPRVGPDDVFVFFFSGHGDQGPDGSAPNQRDGRMESILLYDDDVLSDTLAAWLAAARGRLAIVAVDACFSGGLRNALTRPEQLGIFSSEEDLTSALPEKFQAGGFLSHFLREGLLGRADLDGNERVTAGELSEYMHVMYAQEVRGIQAETREGAHSYQHLVIDRGGVKVNDLVLSIAAVPASAKFQTVPAAGVRGAGVGTPRRGR